MSTFDLDHVVRELKRKIQFATGLLRRVNGNSLRALDKTSATDTVWSRHEFSPALVTGWYMLEARGTRETLGHDLQIRIVTLPLIHLQIGAKITTKRIIRIPKSVHRADFSIVPDLQTGPAAPDQYDLSLVRISERFALDRMQRKLARSNGVVGRRYATDSSELQTLTSATMYTDYCCLLERHVKRIEYREWLAGNTPGLVSIDGPEKKLQLPDRAAPDSSKHLQLTFVLLDHQDALSSLVSTLSSLTPDMPGNVKVVLLMQKSQADVVIQALIRLLPTERIGCGDVALQRVLVAEQDAGHFLVVVGRGVLLYPGLLQELNRRLSTTADTRLYYSDHDVITASGERSCPAFKPGWNPELLLAGNYIGNFLIVSPVLLREVGGFDLASGSSVIYDFLLRASDYLQQIQVERIPRTLFSRSEREQQNRTGMTVGSHDWRILRAHLRRNGYSATVRTGLLDDIMQVEWQVADPQPSVDIIIPTRDRVDLLRCCVDSILSCTRYSNYRITVVDNGSVETATEQYYSSQQSNPRFNVLRYPGEFNYSAINNHAVARTTGDVVLLLNNDTEVLEDQWLTRLVALSMRPQVGCVGAKLYYSNGRIQHAGVTLGIRGVAGHTHQFYPRDSDGYCGRLKIAQNVSAVTAACLAVRREVFNQVGGLDEVNLKVAYNDVDFCLRVLEAGYHNVWTPHVELYHHESVSRGSDDSGKKIRQSRQEYDYMIARWKTDTMNDPSYNPNLALDQEDFWLAA